MAVPKRFKFKSIKKKFQKINNNQNYILPQTNKYFFFNIKNRLWK
jgi:hypothetical protein